ncbi:hypothetical protein Nhal_2503 [Nitrosococcus halophilus Nc 4]|uniref:Uncharacterized protein n=1 Tax=Nitrosococcus halophilus (strain Nc4) TaxID=472759 RepID=D5BW09_NITHN|nr:hypothetical protein Nhal_2503 [Nitrosococcus halophilus Nc 4]
MLNEESSWSDPTTLARQGREKSDLHPKFILDIDNVLYLAVIEEMLQNKWFAGLNKLAA